MRLTRKTDHTQLLEMLAYRAECFPNYPIGGHIPEVFAALGRPIPIGDLLAQPPLPMQPAQEPVAYVTGMSFGRFIVEPLNPAMVLPVGMALYSSLQGNT
jgi:hypothetical protein